jgi:hypothetical protein
MNRKDLCGILFFGWIHHANLRGLKWMCKELSLSSHLIKSKSEIDTYKGYWLVLSMNELVPNTFANKLVISGPHLLPHDIIQSSINDLCIWNALNDWVKNLFISVNPNLKCICAPFPIPYNLPDLTPNQDIEKTDILIYFKQRPYELLTNCKIIVDNLLTQSKYAKDLIRVFEYGKYDYETWTESLKRSKFVIFLIASESQGFAVQEAMSLDVPIIMWDITELNQANIESPRWFDRPEYHKHIPVTGATIWNDADCGIKVNDYISFKNAVQHMFSSYDKYHPRSLLIQHFEPELCLQRFLTIQ